MADPTMVTKTAIFVVDDGITKATGSSDVCAPDPVLLDQCAPFDIVDHQTLCVVGVDAGNAVTPSMGPPTFDSVLYILHMGDETILTVRNN